MRFDIKNVVMDFDNGYYVGFENGKYNYENIGFY